MKNFIKNTEASADEEDVDVLFTNYTCEVTREEVENVVEDLVVHMISEAQTGIKKVKLFMFC